MKCFRCSLEIELVARKNLETQMYYNYWHCDDCGNTKPRSEPITLEMQLEVLRTRFATDDGWDSNDPQF